MNIASRINGPQCRQLIEAATLALTWIDKKEK